MNASIKELLENNFEIVNGEYHKKGLNFNFIIKPSKFDKDIYFFDLVYGKSKEYKPLSIKDTDSFKRKIEKLLQSIEDVNYEPLLDKIIKKCNSLGFKKVSESIYELSLDNEFRVIIELFESSSFGFSVYLSKNQEDFRLWNSVRLDETHTTNDIDNLFEELVVEIEQAKHMHISFNRFALRQENYLENFILSESYVYNLAKNQIDNLLEIKNINDLIFLQKEGKKSFRINFSPSLELFLDTEERWRIIWKPLTKWMENNFNSKIYVYPQYNGIYTPSCLVYPSADEMVVKDFFDTIVTILNNVVDYLEKNTD